MRRTKLYSIAFGGSLLILISFSLLLNSNFELMRRTAFWVRQSGVVIDKLQSLNAAMIDVETSQRGYLLTRDTSFLDLFNAKRDKVQPLMDTILLLVSDNPVQIEKAGLLRSVIHQKIEKLEEILYRNDPYSGKELSARLKEGKIFMDKFRVIILDMQQSEKAILKTRTSSQEEYESFTPKYLFAILVLAIVTAILSFIFLLQELSQRLKAQAQLETKVNTLAQAKAELEQIAYVTTHQLQEPMRKIRMFVDILLSKFAGDLPDEARHMLERMDKNVEGMRTRVADLSNFADLVNLDKEAIEDVDLNRILFEVQQELSLSIAEKKVQFRISQLSRVKGFEMQLHLLFKELLTNALKFSIPTQSAEIIIKGSLVNSEQLNKARNFGSRNFLVVSVCDNGIGFEKQFADKIFVLFQQLNEVDSPYAGKGIGLAVCQRIMANHGGFITAIGEAGVGATFQLYFPIDLP